MKIPSNNPKRKSSQLISSIEQLSDLIQNKTSMKETIKNIVEGREVGNFRSIMWKVCLQIVPSEDSSKWEEVLKLKREEYNKKCSDHMAPDFIHYIYSGKTENVYNSHKKLHLYDESEKYKNYLQNFSLKFLETLNIIKLDVERTFQEIDLFREIKVKETLARILYVWTLENKDIGYCQGMNEILGTMYYALYPSNVMFIEESEGSVTKPKSNQQDSFLFYLINSEENFEADL